MTLPTAMTETYATNLLRDGKNEHFSLGEITRKVSYAPEDPEVILGTYYSAVIGLDQVGAVDSMFHTGVGPTPKAAVRRALEKHGVTFR